jgi:hypothetical protein
VNERRKNGDGERERARELPAFMRCNKNEIQNVLKQSSTVSMEVEEFIKTLNNVD